MGKDTPGPSSEFPIQTYPSISRAMGALDVVFEVTVRQICPGSRWSLASGAL